MKRNTIYLFVSLLVALSIAACEKEKTIVTPVDQFDYGSAFGKHLIRETLLYPDGTEMDVRCKWDSTKLTNIYIKSDDTQLNVLFSYEESKVKEITLSEGSYSVKYKVSYIGDRVSNVVYQNGSMEYGMGFDNLNGVMSTLRVYEGNSSKSYNLTWENGNLVKISKSNFYVKFQYDDKPTRYLDIPSAYFLLGDIYSIVSMSVNNVISMEVHDNGNDTTYISYNYTSDGYPASGTSSSGERAYYLFADGDGSTCPDKNGINKEHKNNSSPIIRSGISILKPFGGFRKTI